MAFKFVLVLSLAIVAATNFADSCQIRPKVTHGSSVGEIVQQDNTGMIVALESPNGGMETIIKVDKNKVRCEYDHSEVGIVFILVCLVFALFVKSLELCGLCELYEEKEQKKDLNFNVVLTERDLKTVKKFNDKMAVV